MPRKDGFLLTGSWIFDVENQVPRPVQSKDEHWGRVGSTTGTDHGRCAIVRALVVNRAGAKSTGGGRWVTTR